MRVWSMQAAAHALLLLLSALPCSTAFYRRLYAWGYNRYGNLGVGASDTPVRHSAVTITS
jgi:hypothetical protein